MDRAGIEGEVRFAVDPPSSSEEALEQARAAKPRTLLLDHKLPGMSGLEVLERIRRWTGRTS